MIVATEQLSELSGQVTMVSGGFDPLHPGHVAYFDAAAELGLPLLCNVAPDDFVRRKHPPLLPQAERAEVIDALRPIAYVHLERSTTADVLAALRPRYFAKGADWRGRLPPEEVARCEALGIEIKLLDTIMDSSSAILERFTASQLSQHG